MANYRRANKERIKQKHAAYYTQNKERLKQQKAAYYAQNKEHIKQKTAAYYTQNKGKIIKCIQERKKNRINTDEIFKFIFLARKITAGAFRRKGFVKKGRTEALLGCSFEEARRHIEKQFKPGMSWENRSEWHIDHIIPLASAKTEEEVIKLCHYTNLQPLWARENLRKGAKHDKPT